MWHLRLLVRSPDIDTPLQVTADYGFFNCKTVKETNSLKEIYGKLLESPTVDPMDLHAACIKGKIYTIPSDIKGVGAGAPDEVEPPSFLLFLALFFFSFLAFLFIWLPR